MFNDLTLKGSKTPWLAKRLALWCSSWKIRETSRVHFSHSSNNKSLQPVIFFSFNWCFTSHFYSVTLLNLASRRWWKLISYAFTRNFAQNEWRLYWFVKSPGAFIWKEFSKQFTRQESYCPNQSALAGTHRIAVWK